MSSSGDTAFFKNVILESSSSLVNGLGIQTDGTNIYFNGTQISQSSDGYWAISGSNIYNVNSGNVSVGVNTSDITNTQFDYTFSIGQFSNIAFDPSQDNGKMFFRNDIVIDSITAQRIRLGRAAGNNNQGPNTISIGNNSGVYNQGERCLALGNDAGYSNQGDNAVSIGFRSGYIGQNTNSIAIGYESGNVAQSTLSTAIGYYCGNDNQGSQSVAIGNQSGQFSQNADSVAIGYLAG